MGAPIATGHVVAGRYRLMSALGNGGMGTVWLAEDDLLSRQVAVKEVSPPADMTEHERELLRERTLREARTAARLSHPNVVTIYDVVEDDGRPWIVMELVPSRSLRDVVDAGGPLTAQQAAAAGLQVLAALRAAHALGIMHRDVKPGNVLIDEGGRAVLADFGIARTQDSPALTTSGMVVGSPSYIAPERARGEQGGPESDLWSLGATLYALVEGRPAYDRGGALPTLMAVVNEDPDPPSRAGELWPVIRGLLDHVPSRRLGPDEAGRMLRQIAGSSDGSGTVPLPRLAQETGPGGDPGRTRAGSSLGSSEDTRTLRPWDAVLAGEPDPGALAEEAGPDALAEEAGPDALPGQPDPDALQEQPGPVPLPEQPGPDALQEQPAPGVLPGDPSPGAFPEEPGSGTFPHEPGSGTFPHEPGLQILPDTPPRAEPAKAPPGRLAPHRPHLTLVLAAAVLLALAAGVVVAMVMTSHHTALATPNPGGPTGHPASSRSAGPNTASSAPPTAQPSSPAPGSGPGPLGPAVIPAGYHEFRNSTGFTIAVPDGWRVSHQGHYVYLVPPSGAEFLLIDQSDHPQPNPLADWQQQEASRESTYPGYHRIRLQSVHYPQAEKAADWEFTYYHQGVLTHVLNRNILANSDHAYALYWSTPASQWGQSWRIFKVLAQTFRPAAP
ncbi:MAG TPA: protein kinase [Streptosporangiaceae bacterium]